MKSPKVSNEKKTLSAEKIKAIKSMYPWMPQVDKEYFEAILPKLSLLRQSNNIIYLKQVFRIHYTPFQIVLLSK